MINTREIAEEYRLSHWAQIMQDRVQSGLSINAYCKQIGICGNTYFYWQRRVRTAVCEQLTPVHAEQIQTRLPIPSFTEVRVAEPAAPLVIPEATTPSSQLCIETAGVRITTDSTYPPDKLAALLKELSRPC